MSKDLAMEMMEQEFHVSNGQQLELLNWTKSDITEKAQAVVFAVADGVADPVKEYLKVKKALEFFTQAEKNLKPYFNEQQLNKGEKYFGCEVVEKELGVKYDYTACNDPEWDALNARMIALKAELDAREKFLKGITKPLNSFDDNSGEVFTINPPVKTGSLGKSVTIK